MSEKFTIDRDLWDNPQAIPQMALFHMMSASGTYSDEWVSKFNIDNHLYDLKEQVLRTLSVFGE